MEQRPFQCPNCGNWYTPVPLAEGESCGQCALGTHNPHRITGIVDCHYGQKSATPSEVRMMGVLASVRKTRDAAATALRGVGTLKAQGEVVALLSRVETSLAMTEQAIKDVAEIQTWAGVFEMPGMAGEDPRMRFKDQNAMKELVKNNRRPPEDLEELRRSVKVCQALAAEIPPLVAEIRVTVGQVRQAAYEWKAPAAGETVARAAPKKRARRGGVAKRVKQPTPTPTPVAASA